MAYTFPHRHLKPLRWLLDQSEADLDKFTQAVAELRPEASLTSVAASLGETLSVPKEKAREVLGLLVSIRLLFEGVGPKSAETFVSGVLASARDSGDLQYADEPWTRLRSFLESLIPNPGPLWLAGKANSLRFESERSYCRAQVFTDARPIYGLDPARKPEAFVVLHSLKLSVHTADSVEDFFIALDATDLKQLKATIERALQKESSLVEFLTSSGTPVLARGE